MSANKHNKSKTKNQKITKQIIELINEKIYLESMKNVGTQVTIKLNLAKK
ncbi:MAG: hypothetical protein U9P70_01020 [Patescibacteria group bacterium]|nr:hypothetical protein [Patescibacteria group bacterium]